VFGLFRQNGRRPSDNFYRNLFALLTFAALAAALVTKAPAAMCAVLLFGALSRSAVRKDWKNPRFARFAPWLCRTPRAGDGDDDR